MLAALFFSIGAWAAPVDGTYLGHSYVSHPRAMPILGTVEARTDTWVLARIVSTERGVEIQEQPCEVVIKPVAGVRVKMLEGAVRRLPPVRFELSGEELSGKWRSGWEEQDLDQDGLPGVTMRVQASLCSGSLQVASQTSSRAVARWQGEELVGSLEVEVQQRILGATGACLKAAAKDQTDSMRGAFRYRRVAEGTSCEAAGGWPVAG